MTPNGPTPLRQAPLQAGAYAPILTFFHPGSEDLDLETQKQHAVRLVQQGLVGLVALGSNGEAVHQTHEERKRVIAAVREALDAAGFQQTPLIAGCSAQSVRESILMTQEAATAGASYALILPPCYYQGMLDADTVVEYYTSVADHSPIPILMYNYPGAVAGVDLDSDTMIRIAKHANVQGAKLTCANVGKLTRLAKATEAISVRGRGSGFLCTAGFADITIQTAISDGSGTIVGTGNVFPRLSARPWTLWAEGKHDEAVQMQQLLAEADWLLSKSGIPGTRAALQAFHGYGGVSRKPLPSFPESQTRELVARLDEAWKVEQSLSSC